MFLYVFYDTFPRLIYKNPRRFGSIPFCNKQVLMRFILTFSKYKIKLLLFIFKYF